MGREIYNIKNDGCITDAIRGLFDYEEKGPEVSKMFNVITDHRHLFVSKNYVFYRIEDKIDYWDE